MGLLDGGLKAVFGGAFASIYLPGTLHKAARSYDDGGTISQSFVSFPIRVQRDDVTEAMRGEAGYTERDVALIVLSQGVPVEPSTDDEITVSGVRYKLGQVGRDAASSHWFMRGTPA